MPRKPTGNPRGRPKGTGDLGEATRITFWLSKELHTRLDAYAEGRGYTRGVPQIARCVREAIEHFLSCPHKRQTINVLRTHEDNLSQIENVPGMTMDTNGQIKNVPLVHDARPAEGGDNKQQTENVLAEGGEEKQQTRIEPPVPAQPEPEDTQRQTDQPSFEATKYALGKLCPRGHDEHGTGQSLRSRTHGRCLACDREKSRDQRQAKRQTAAPPEPAGSTPGAPRWDKAAILAQLDAWKQAGLSFQAMAERLETSQVPTLSGRGHWSRGTVAKLLQTTS